MVIKKKQETLLKIGKIPYTNLFPIFYMLQRECDCSRYEFIEGVPSVLNRLLRTGEIDISPSSSIEYLRHKDKYNLIKGHSISSKGPIESILLLSKKPIEELEGKTILVTSQSETSVALLNIILRKFHKITCSLMPTDEPLDSVLGKATAYLAIGDDALKAKKTISNFKFQISNKDQNSSLITHHSLPVNIYDLGDLWYRNTGLPFVFALWIARKDCFTEKAGILERFIRDLEKSKELALQNLDKIAQELKPILLSSHSLNIPEKELISYWNKVSYDLTEEHERGLELFGKYSKELGLLVPN